MADLLKAAAQIRLNLEDFPESDVLENDLAKIPSILCMSTEIDNLLQCVEKGFCLTANYAKGHGSMFEQWIHVDHPTTYLYPILCACGGSRQDLGVEGAPVVLMNLPYNLQFFHWCLSIGIGRDSI